MSTQKQGEGVSLEAQRAAITAFASQNDLTVTRWFEEKETAAKTGRPLFGQMLGQLKQGKADGLIMHKIDRSARNLRDWALISELPKFGVKPYFAADGLDFETRGGRLSANLQAVIAEDFIFNLREETIKGMNGRLKQGLFPWKAPPGYLDCGSGKPKAPCPKVAPLIRLLFDLYASGQHSYVTLLKQMHQQGLRNMRGGQLTLCGLGNILQNPFYIGLIYIKSSGKTYQGVHKPIVSPATWQRVQAIRSSRSGPKVTRHHHLFQGLFKCGLCGGPMVPEKQKGHVYYRCKRPSCPTKTIREEALTKAIIQELEILTPSLPSTNLIDAQTAPDGPDREDDLRQSLNLRISDEQRRLDRLEDLLIDGTITDETYSRKCKTIKIRLSTLQEEAAKAPTLKKLAKHQEQLAELRKNLALLYKIANRVEKRLIIENVWPNRTVIRDQPSFEPYNWVSGHEKPPPLL
ncbi:recombinase family protein, partial [Jannaschia sp. KMU-145]|uniref:recombinase family protein n=1 Tax=Jannaschia halovivens TaxID=3388667 RepID=UPI00396B1A31